MAANFVGIFKVTVVERIRLFAKLFLYVLSCIKKLLVYGVTLKHENEIIIIITT